MLVGFYSKFIVEKIWNCFDSFIYSTTDVYPLNPPMKGYFSPNSFYLYAIIFNCVNLLPPARISSFVRIFFIYVHFWESLLFCNNLFKPFFIFENLFLFMIICENLLEQFRFLQSLWKQASVWIPSSKKNLWSTKHGNILLTSYVPNLCFLLWILLILFLFFY